MNTNDFLLLAITFLTSALIVVPLAKKLRLGNVLGYLIAGVLIGPSCFALISDPLSILKFSEFGVVFLLFVIGLELKPQRLWTMRRGILGQGLLQVFITTLLFSLVCYQLGYSPQTAVLIGFSLALSSTAFALQMLAEKKQLTADFGRSAFSILLFQDIAVIPFMAVIPYLAGTTPTSSHPLWVSILVLIAVFTALKLLIPYFFRFIALAENREVFTAATLLIVLSISYLMESLHLSMALGSFLSGVLLSDSEYRHELESDIEPFKGLLLGLFFMAVGMSANLSLFTEAPVTVLGTLALYLIVKYLSLLAVGKLSRFSLSSSRKLASTLIQGSEFAFVILGLGVNSKVLPVFESDVLILVISLSMALTPLISAIHEWIDDRKENKSEKKFDEIHEENPVIIAGFGRFGQIFARILRLKNIGFTALELDPNQVEFVRKFGNQAYYGDASRLDLLEKAGAHKAKLFILAIDDKEASVHIAKIVKERFPNLKILARARNRQHVFELMDLGITDIERETFWSALKLSEKMLKELNFTSSDTKNIIDKFQYHDDRMVSEQHRIHKNEKDLINYAIIAQKQLQDVFRDDNEIK